MSHGSPSPLAPTPPAPITIEPTMEKTKGDLKERLRRSRSRALSQVSDIGFLDSQPAMAKNELSNVLGV